MSYYMMDYSMTNPGTPGWQFAPVPGWGVNPAAAGPRRVGVGQDARTAPDLEGRYSQTSYGMVAAVGAGALLLGVFLGYVAGKRAQKRTTANYRRNSTKRRTSTRRNRSRLTANVRWSTKYKNQLPDSAFFYVAPGGRKERTTRGTFTIPKSKRKLPYKSLSGRVDRGHLLAAIGRAGQKKTQIPAAEKKRIQGRAQRMYGRDFGYKTAPTRALPRAA